MLAGIMKSVAVLKTVSLDKVANGIRWLRLQMTLVDVKTETLVANATAIGGAEHYNGVQLVANYEYEYK